jgi:CRP-like cAMP-binding protein
MRSLRVQCQTGDQAIELAVRRFTMLCPLEDHELDLVRGLARTLDLFPEGRELAREGSAIGAPRMIVSGWASRYKMLPDGRRQILSFLAPGDCIGLCLRAHPLGLANTIALSAVQTLALDPILDAARHDERRYPNLRRAICVGQAIDEVYLIEQVVRVGRRTAYERMCHLLLELHHRLALVGLAQDWRFPMPLTQEILADVTSLSIVHVNRTLTQLRRERLVEIKQGYVTLLEPALLVGIADFSPPEPSEWRQERAL